MTRLSSGAWPSWRTVLPPTGHSWSSSWGRREWTCCTLLIVPGGRHCSRNDLLLDVKTKTLNVKFWWRDWTYRTIRKPKFF
jgi:hypothetical protein